MNILNKSFEELSDPPARFKRLDMKLKAAAKRIANHGILATEIDTKTSELENNNMILRGLQILWLIMRKNKIDEKSTYLFGFNDMNKVKLVNGDLLSMVTEWEATLARCPMGALNDKHILEPMFFALIEEHAPLAEAMFHYKSVGPDHPDRSYQYLMAEAKRVIERVTVDANRARVQQAIAAGPSSARPLGTAKALAARENEKVNQQPPTQPSSAAPAPLRNDNNNKRYYDRADVVARNLCFAFQNGKCNKKDCTFTHELAKEGTKPRSPSPTRKPISEIPCKFFLNGACTKGSSCPFSHNTPTAAAAPAAKGSPQ